MRCFAPISVITKGEKRVCPCGRCAACISNTRIDWVTRMQEELRHSKSAHFLTLTYSNGNLIYGKEPWAIVDKREMQLWVKKLRAKTKNNEIRYFIVGEYGTKSWRPHYHAIIFNLKETGDALKLLILQTWGKGKVDIGTVTPASISYVTGYLVQKKELNLTHPSFSLKSSGLGKIYIQKRKKWHNQDISRNYVQGEDGKKRPLPRYFREKIYTKVQRDIQTKMSLDSLYEDCSIEEQKFEIINEIAVKESFKKKVNRKLKNGKL